MPSKYEYTSYSSSSKGGNKTDDLFTQADTNRDGVIDRDEFENFVEGSTSRTGGRYLTSSYESTGGFDASAISQAASYTAETNAAWSRYGAEVRAPGLYVDPHPEIIRRTVAGGVQTITQNIRLRFLQPPPVPAAGPLIVKEVRPPQPAAPPPLRIKQYEQAVTQLAPLILREKPPLPPAPIPSETVVRHLPALPMPPRSVVIERYPAAPSAARDIIIERWLPYTTCADRKTIVQRAEGVTEYAAPRNVIIQYEVPQVRIVRQFQNLGVIKESPEAYIARHGSHLLDSHTLVHEARAAGVVEDLTIPANITSGFNAVSLSSDGTYREGGTIHDLGVIGTTRDLGGASSSYSTSVVKSSSVGGASGLDRVGYEHEYVEGGGNDYGSSGHKVSSYKSSSTYSSGGATSSDVASSGFKTTTTEAKL